MGDADVMRGGVVRTPLGATLPGLTALLGATLLGLTALLGLPAAAAAQEQEQEQEAEDPWEALRAAAPEAVQARAVTLEEATEMALRRSPALEQARASVEVAEFDRLGAYGSFLPRLNLGYNYSNASTGRLDPTGQSITRTSWTMQLGASYDLFTGFRRMSDLRSARLGVDAEDARYHQRRYETLFLVKQAFFASVAANELVRVEEDRVRRQTDQLDFVEQRVRLGQATRADLLRSQVDLNNARLALLNAENEARTATFQLAEAVGVDEPLAPTREATLESPPLAWTRDQLLAAAEAAAPSVQTARAVTEAAEASVASSRSTYLPNLTLSGGWAWQAPEFPPADRSWAVQVSGNYPLFNGFQRESAVMRAQAQADAAQAQERATRLAIRADVDAAYGRVQSARAGVALAEQSVELSRESLRVVQERYRLGLATILDLQQAQIALRQAEVDLVNRQFDHQLGIAQLESLIGRPLWGEPAP